MAYGLEVFNSAGTKKIVSITDRLLRVVTHGYVTINPNSYVDITITGMANDDSWTVGLNTPLVSSFVQDWYYTKSTNNLRIGFNTSQSSPSSQSISFYVFRS
tara:strand:- start:1856 stop:2161 length:306 start_codon:yes stop_codon:yes gene_type:complete